MIPKLLSTKSKAHSDSHQLSTLQKKSRINAKDRIYVQNEVEVHSTTALKTDADGCSQSMEQESQHEDFHATVESKHCSEQ